MKKHLILFAGLVVLIALLLCGAAGAEPLTIEEIKARNGNITEEELAEYLASFDNRDNGFDLAVGPNYTLDDRKIRLNQMPLTVPNSGETVWVQLVNTYYDIADDVILVWDKEGNRFSGRPAEGTAITLDSGIHVDSANSALAEGSKVLLIEKNGDLHAFYAGAGTNSGKLVAGKKLYIMRCFNESHFHTPNGGVDIPISFASIPFLDGSGNITAGEDGTLNINIDVDSEWEWWGFIPIAYHIYLRDCSLGISLPNLTIHMERYTGWFSVEIPLVEIVEPLAYGFAIDMSPTFSLEGVGAGDTVLSVSAREGFYLWAEIMTVYDSGDYSIHLTKAMEKELTREQERFRQEDTLAGQIYAFMESFTGDKLCSRQIYKEALAHPYDEPKQWETREIFEVVTLGITNGEIRGWRPFVHSRRFEKYGTQRGWERIPTEQETDIASPVNQNVNQPVDDIRQMGFVDVDPDADFPF